MPGFESVLHYGLLARRYPRAIVDKSMRSCASCLERGGQAHRAEGATRSRAPAAAADIDQEEGRGALIRRLNLKVE